MLSDDEMHSLYYSAACNDVDELRKRLEAGLDANSQVRLQEGKPLRPLIVAAACNRASDVVQLLIEHGATVDARDAEGNTALLGATQKKDKTTVKLLLAAGADRTIKSADGKTAEELTRSEAIKALLRGDATDEEEEEDDDDHDGEDDDGDDDDSGGVTEYSVAALEAYHDRKMPVAYRAFIEEKKYEKFDGKKFPMPSYEGGIVVRFAKKDDGGALEVPSLLHEAGDFDEEAAQDLIPFGAIWLNDEYRDAQFILIDSTKPQCPVVMFEHETGQFEAVAESIDEFLKSEIR